MGRKYTDNFDRRLTEVAMVEGDILKSLGKYFGDRWDRRAIERLSLEVSSSPLN